MVSLQFRAFRANTIGPKPFSSPRIRRGKPSGVQVSAHLRFHPGAQAARSSAFAGPGDIMDFPTIATLRTADPWQLEHLPHELRTLPNVQRRLVGRSALVPAVDLEAYSFSAVVDWIDITLHFGRGVQVQQVQPVLLKFLPRNCYIKPIDGGPGGVFTKCTIRIQEPENLALVFRVHRALVDAFGEATGSRVTALEVSVDAYPTQPADSARRLLLGAWQRTIWTGRDIWSDPDSRLRSINGRGSESVLKLTPPPAYENPLRSGPSEAQSRSVPWDYSILPVDSTVYLGAEHDEVMIRIMDKVIDQQKGDGTFRALTEDEKRTRIEVTLQGTAPADLGLTYVASLKTLNLAGFQKRFFQFKLPTFQIHDHPQTGPDMTRNAKEIWRARTYLRAGVTGLMAMDAETKKGKAAMMPAVKANLTAMGKTMTGAPRLGDHLVSYEEMNKRVNVAVRDLAKREARAWKNMEKEMA